jgi:hypothetical protein
VDLLQRAAELPGQLLRRLGAVDRVLEGPTPFSVQLMRLM